MRLILITIIVIRSILVIRMEKSYSNDNDQNNDNDHDSRRNSIAHNNDNNDNDHKNAWSALMMCTALSGEAHASASARCWRASLRLRRTSYTMYGIFYTTSLGSPLLCIAIIMIIIILAHNNDHNHISS